jgi:HD-like signal output (HDOD) protein
MAFEALDIDLPALPDVLLKLSLLMAEENVDVPAMAALVEADMALASSVMKAVNSPLYGLRTRAQTVQQALTYLGTREIVAITYEMAMRAAFPPAPELAPIWERAARRGLLMGRIAQRLGVDAWTAHSAGLFQECGKAVLLRHAPDHYPSMLRAAGDDIELTVLENAGFRMSHDALGALLTESWGLAPAAVASVRHHLRVRATAEVPASVPEPAICVVAALAEALITMPKALAEVADRLAPQARLDPAQALRAAQQVAAQVAGAGTP